MFLVPKPEKDKQDEIAARIIAVHENVMKLRREAQHLLNDARRVMQDYFCGKAHGKSMNTPN